MLLRKLIFCGSNLVILSYSSYDPFFFLKNVPDLFKAFCEIWKLFLYIVFEKIFAIAGFLIISALSCLFLPCNNLDLGNLVVWLGCEIHCIWERSARIVIGCFPDAGFINAWKNPFKCFRKTHPEMNVFLFSLAVIPSKVQRYIIYFSGSIVSHEHNPHIFIAVSWSSISLCSFLFSKPNSYKPWVIVLNSWPGRSPLRSLAPVGAHRTGNVFFLFFFWECSFVKCSAVHTFSSL